MPVNKGFEKINGMTANGDPGLFYCLEFYQGQVIFHFC